MIQPRLSDAWLKWGVGILLPLYASALLFVYGVISARQDRTEARMDAFAAASLEDRRELAVRQVEMTTRQAEQFGRIMAELAQLRSELAATGRQSR